MKSLTEYVWLVFVLVGVGAPALLFQLLVRPRATVTWIRQGGGRPSPAEIADERAKS